MITVIQERKDGGEIQYQAVSGTRKAIGSSLGTALDALSHEMDAESLTDRAISGTVILVQQFQPDIFFSAEQRERLSSLMKKWREARDSGATLPSSEMTELESLVQAETEAMGSRTSSLLEGVRGEK